MRLDRLLPLHEQREARGYGTNEDEGVEDAERNPGDASEWLKSLDLLLTGKEKDGLGSTTLGSLFRRSVRRRLTREPAATPSRDAIGERVEKNREPLEHARRCYVCGIYTICPMKLRETECPHVACCLGCLHRLHNMWIDIKFGLQQLEREVADLPQP